MKTSRILFLSIPFLVVPSLGFSQVRLSAHSRIDTTLAPGTRHEYSVRLGNGHSASLVVHQRGVDVIVEILNAADSVLQSVDGPTGRTGDEMVELFAARVETYRVRVRPFDEREPAGRYLLEVTGWRDSRATNALLAARRRARDSATAWLRPMSAPLGPLFADPLGAPLATFDSLAQRVEVLGIGEATHGSREIGDVRLRLTRRLIEQHGYRVVAIEASSSRLAALDRLLGRTDSSQDWITALVESGWIGRRTLRELVRWLGEWNRAHPIDRVRLVGLDPQDNERALADLHRLIAAGYGPDVQARYLGVERELAVADSQSSVFGDSQVDSTARRFLLDFVAHIEQDAPLLRHLVDSETVRAGAEAARALMQFADFNAANSDLLGHSRDWYMATNLLQATQSASHPKAVYWAHNAHVAAPNDRAPGGRPMGSWLRAALGCRYGAVAVTFGEGAFVAQIPNDLEDDLGVDTLPPAPDESIEGVVGRLHPDGSVVTWPCHSEAGAVPGWLVAPHPMHWVGALFRPGTPPSETFRPFVLVRDFDGLVYIPKVSADEAPRDRPLIPARKRN